MREITAAVSNAAGEPTSVETLRLGQVGLQRCYGPASGESRHAGTVFVRRGPAQPTADDFVRRCHSASNPVPRSTPCRSTPCRPYG